MISHLSLTYRLTEFHALPCEVYMMSTDHDTWVVSHPRCSNSMIMNLNSILSCSQWHKPCAVMMTIMWHPWIIMTKSSTWVSHYGASWLECTHSYSMSHWCKLYMITDYRFIFLCTCMNHWWSIISACLSLHSFNWYQSGWGMSALNESFNWICHTALKYTDYFTRVRYHHHRMNT